MAWEAANEALGSAPMMSPEVEQLIGKAVVELKAAGARQVFAFGSAARGTLRPDSDLDLAVSGLPPARFYRAMARASDAAGRAIDLLDLDRPTPFGRYLVEENELVCVG